MGVYNGCRGMQRNGSCYLGVLWIAAFPKSERVLWKGRKLKIIKVIRENVRLLPKRVKRIVNGNDHKNIDDGNK